MFAGLLRPRAEDGERIDVGGLVVRLRVSARATRVSLRIDPASGEAVATAPSARRLAEAAAFARARRDWLQAKLVAVEPDRPFVHGAVLPFRGQPVLLAKTPGAGAARLSLGGDTLSAGGDKAGFARRIAAFLRREARRELSARTAVHAARLGVATPTISLGDPRTRWGSCTAARAAIRYSWRLILCPPDVLDYVAAHEVAHLAESNHGPRFWAVVRRLYGDPAQARAWLKRNGASLHAVGRDQAGAFSQPSPEPS